MPEPENPDAALTFGRENWYYVPAGGFSSGIFTPKVADLTAASVLDFTMMAFADGTTTVTQSTNRIEAQRRVGSTIQYERKGVSKLTGGSLSYGIQPQAVAGSIGKKAYEKFLGGPDGGFLAQRLDVGRAVNLAAGQFFNIYPADLGPSLVTKVGDGEAGEVAGNCDYFVRGPIAQLVALGT